MVMEPKSTLTSAPQASFSMEDFAKALETHDYSFQKGQIVSGKVEVHDHNGVYVDIGGKSTAIVPLSEISVRQGVDPTEVLPLGVELEFMVIREQDEEGQITLSRRQLEMKQLWNNLAEMQESSQSVQVRVTGVNKGGVTVDVQGLRGFIPRSHLNERNDLDALKGQSLTAAFLEVNPATRKVVLSQRLATQSAGFSQLEKGQLVTGRVSGIKPFGLFLDLGNATGLIHIKQISQKFIESLASHFELGQELKAMVIDLDEVKNRISLSTRVLENYPGEILENLSEVMTTAEARHEKAAKKLAEG